MNILIETEAKGQLDWLEVRDKHGNLKHRVENVPNMILDAMLASYAYLSVPQSAGYTHTSTAENYEDVNGTWNQSGNTITRATGTGIFGASAPSHIGHELYWYNAGSDTGHRCFVTARTSDTQITVSGLPKTITGGSLRRYFTTGAAGSPTSTSGYSQQSSSSTPLPTVYDDVAGTCTRSTRYNFASSTSAYTMGSVMAANSFRVKLPTPIPVAVDDQVQFVYSATETVTGRSQVYELGAESIGLPMKYPVSTIVGDGTNVDVTFAAATHFLAGDKLDLRNVTTKKFAISSASSTSTTLTINTTVAHGRSPGDSITIEGAPVAGYNGVFTADTGTTGSTIVITDASNPGTMGAGGTARLTTPATYFDDLGLATIASMVSSSVARITSAITGPAADTASVGGDPGVTVKFRRPSATSDFYFTLYIGNPPYHWYFPEAQTKAIVDETTVGTATVTGGVNFATSAAQTATVSAAPANDFTFTQTLEKSSGAGSDWPRIKQFVFGQVPSGSCYVQVTFNTCFTKSTTQRFRVTLSKKVQRSLVTP